MTKREYAIIVKDFLNADAELRKQGITFNIFSDEHVTDGLSAKLNPQTGLVFAIDNLYKENASIVEAVSVVKEALPAVKQRIAEMKKAEAEKVEVKKKNEMPGQGSIGDALADFLDSLTELFTEATSDEEPELTPSKQTGVKPEEKSEDCKTEQQKKSDGQVSRPNAGDIPSACDGAEKPQPAEMTDEELMARMMALFQTHKDELKQMFAEAQR